jgi:uncharacterized membrane protein
MTPLQWSPPLPAAGYLGLALGLVFLILLARHWASSPTARSWLLLLLRAVVLAFLLAVLVNPVQVAESRLPPRPAEVAYLVDCSRSMALDRPVQRMAVVKQAIEQAQRRIPADRLPHISLYGFGQQFAAATTVNDLQPGDDATRLLEALERLPARFESVSPKGVVVFSDGRTSENAGFDEVAESYRHLGLPIHVFPVGDRRTIGDVAIQEVIAPRESVTGARVPVRVQVRSRGFRDRRAEIRVRSFAEPARKPLATLPIMLNDGVQSYELLVTPDTAGGKLVVEVPPQDEEALLENNQVVFQIGARKRKTRVLYMEGTLSNEYHFVHDALNEDPDIECISVEVNNQYALKPTLHRVNDPQRGFPTTREELFTFDVVICSDIAKAAFTPQQIDWTVELVAKRGGGFIMIGGNTSFGAGDWDRTPWDALIPVEMSQVRGTYWVQPFRIEIPAAVESHPIWKIVEDPVKNREILRRMPPFSGTNLVRRIKPGATALGFSERAFDANGKLPIFSCEPYGQGRTFAMTTDTTVDWGREFENTWGEGDNRYFRKFWRNVIHWLVENAAAGNRRLRVDTDRILYRPEQPIKITARAYDDKLEETKNYRLVARLRPPTASGSAAAPLVETTLVASANDLTYQGELAVPAFRSLPGGATGSTSRTLSLDVTAYDQNRAAAETKLDVQVFDDSPEFQDPQPDFKRLEEIAQLSGGKVLHSPDELAKVLTDLKPSEGEVLISQSPAWDSWPVWLLLIAVLGCEWVIRRLWGLA